MSETAAVHMTASARLVAGALAEAEQSTVTALTDASGVSKSTVAKALALLERCGAAIRTVREVDGIRKADLWCPGPALSTQLFAAVAGVHLDGEMPATATEATSGPSLGDAPVDGGGAEERHGRAAVDSVQESNRTANERESLAAGAVVGFRVASDVEPEQAVSPKQVADSVAEAGVRVKTSSVLSQSTNEGRPLRLGPGELAAKVVAVLAEHPEIEYTPTMVSHLLGDRSPGAIHNVLEKMVGSGPRSASATGRSATALLPLRHRMGLDPCPHRLPSHLGLVYPSLWFARLAA